MKEKRVQLQDQFGNDLFPKIKPEDQNLGAIVSDTPPKAIDGRIYYNSKDKLFYVARGGMWDRLYVLGDEKLEQKAPEKAPELESKTDTTVILKEQENMEYRYQGGAWQSSTYFSNLQRNESYLFEQRFKANEVYKESDPSPALTVRTDKGIQSAPNNPKYEIVEELDDKVRVRVYSNEPNVEVAVRIGTGKPSETAWSPSGTIYRLDYETKHIIYARRKETNTHKASPASSGMTFTTPDAVRTWGVMIDTKNANPNTRVKYTDDAVGFSPVKGNNGNIIWGSWKNTTLYEAFRPCVVKDGKVQYYLDRDDFTKKADGGNAVLTGADGDVMIEISKLWVSIKRNTNGIHVRVSDGYQDGFSNMAFKNGDKEVDKIYVGAYLGYSQNGKLRSISGVEPTGNRTIGTFRDLAEANGNNYHLVPMQPLILLQAVMTIMLKSTDTQSALGRGHVDDYEGYSKTGNTNKKGMMFGERRGKRNTGQMCFMGIEDFWGNKHWWIEGCYYDDGEIKMATNNFGSSESYITVGEHAGGSGYIEDVMGGDLTGFIPKECYGSNSTYYCDEGQVSDGSVPYFGGFAFYGNVAGGFHLDCYIPDYTDDTLSARLFMYGK